MPRRSTTAEIVKAYIEVHGPEAKEEDLYVSSDDEDDDGADGADGGEEEEGEKEEA